jgi:hypothetical protein
MGRPVGSTNGRVPAGGYPAVSPELGGFLAGYIEGEGCFAVRRQHRGFGYRPTMSIVARSDDAALLAALHDVTRIGTITGRRARHTSRSQAAWTVTAKMDCARLVELLDRYRLRGRKREAFLPWRAAVRHWVGEDPTARLTPADWSPFAAWKRAIQVANAYDADCASHSRDQPTADGWRAYLAGLITAEGHFGIDRTLRPTFTIHLRSDDLPLLHWLRTTTSLGRVYGPYPPSGLATSPSARWMTSSASDNLGLVDLLEGLQPGGRKLLELLIWREAVLERSCGSGWSRTRLTLARDRLLAARAMPADQA